MDNRWVRFVNLAIVNFIRLALSLPLTWGTAKLSALGSEGMVIASFCRFTPTTDSLKDTTLATVFVTAFEYSIVSLYYHAENALSNIFTENR